MAYKVHNSAAQTIQPMIHASDIEDTISISPMELIHLMLIPAEDVQCDEDPGFLIDSRGGGRPGDFSHRN